MGKTKKPKRVYKSKRPKLKTFPECIGIYPDVGCTTATPEKPGMDCTTCPQYRNRKVKEDD
jgi:hypothetical protein